jgi:hypothetical protein
MSRSVSRTRKSLLHPSIPSLTPTDYALISGNNVTKVAIVMELANQEKATLIDLRRSTERHCSATGTTRFLSWKLAEQLQAIRDLKGDVPNKMASLEQKGRTDSHPRLAGVLVRKRSDAEPGAQSA